MLLVNLWPSHHYNWESFDCLAKMKLTRINCKAIKTQVMINEKRIFPFSENAFSKNNFPKFHCWNVCFWIYWHSLHILPSRYNPCQIQSKFFGSFLLSFCNAFFYRCSTLRTHWLLNQLGNWGIQSEKSSENVSRKTRRKECETTSLVVLTGQWQHCNTKWKSRVLQMKKWR